MKTYQEQLKAIVNDGSIHFWVTRLAANLDTADVCDALRGLDTLTALFQVKLEEIQGGAK